MQKCTYIPQYLAKTFSNESDKHKHHTRITTHQSLNLVKLKNNQQKRIFKYNVAVNWNDLNRVIRKATGIYNLNLPI